MQYFQSIKFLKIKIILFLLLFSIGCRKNIFPKTISSLEKLSQHHFVDNQVYLVIPNAGCDGCISYSEEFVKTNYKKYPNLIFILTSISSQKKLKYILGDSILKSNNVVIDSNNVFLYPQNENKIYPLVIYTNKDNITKIEYQNPNSEGIGNLITYYATHK